MATDGYQFPGMTDLMSNTVNSAAPRPGYPQGGLPAAFDPPNLNFDPSPYHTSPVQESPTSLPQSPTTGKSPKVEEDAKAAAEEDKRRRNTAASARFRVKKKQREQALEKREKELTEKMSAMEKRIGKLEEENGILRSLVTEKSGKEDFKKLYEKLRSSSEEAEDSERSPKQTRKGVGTKGTKA